MKREAHIFWIMVAVVIIFMLGICCSKWYHKKYFNEYDIRLAKLDSIFASTNIDSLTSDDVKIESLRNEIHTINYELRKDFDMFIWGIPLTLLGIIGLFYAAYKEAKNKVSDYADQLKSEEASLRENAKIAIIPATSTFAIIHLK